MTESMWQVEKTKKEKWLSAIQLSKRISKQTHEKNPHHHKNSMFIVQHVHKNIMLLSTSLFVKTPEK